MSKYTSTPGVVQVISWMKSNSLAWWKADTAGRKDLAQKNQAAALVLNGAFGVPAVYSAEDGEWYVGEIGGEKLYSVIG